MHDFTKDELRVFQKLSTPRKIQDYLDELPANFCIDGHTCYSPRMVLREKKAHCIEGAMFAAAALRFAGYPPLIFELKSVQRDDDHVMALFQEKGAWGAISKTNHGVLRYREPIYRSLRELAMSFFHEYFLDDGAKTMRSYSVPVNLSRFDRINWMTSEENVWEIPNSLMVYDTLKLPIARKSRSFGRQPPWKWLWAG
jgi:hypothetical protein